MTTDLTFQCPPEMVPHVNAVLNGEYDLPYQREKPVILDIGANVGGFAIWASRRWPHCEIHCYEPMPENFAMLAANVEILKKAGINNRITINNFAIGDPAHTKLFRGQHNCGEASFFDFGSQTSDFVEVSTFAPTCLPPAQILKLDTEGCEIEILSGLPAINFDVVLLEYHSEKNRRAADSLLQDYVLAGSHATHRDFGTLKFLHQRLFG